MVGGGYRTVRILNFEFDSNNNIVLADLVVQVAELEQADWFDRGHPVQY